MRLRYMDRSNAIRGSKKSILSRQPCQQLHSLLCLVTIALLVGVAIKPLHHDGGDGIAGRSRRVLKWLASCSQHAKKLLFAARAPLRVEKAARDWIEKAVDHGICDATCEIEIAEVGCGFVRVQASDCCESIIVEQACNPS